LIFVNIYYVNKYYNMNLTDDQLLANPNTYSINLLELNIHNLNKKILLATQKLTAEFCIKYILDLDIDNGSEDSYIYDVDYILDFQKHLTIQEFKELLALEKV
jgi:hypothetical protein